MRPPRNGSFGGMVRRALLSGALLLAGAYLALSCIGCSDGSPTDQKPGVAAPVPTIPKGKPDGVGSSDAPDDFGPLADARERVRRFEAKRTALQRLLDKALAEHDELVDRLRDAGVQKPADLKGNRRGQQLAGSLQRLTTEIDGLERTLAAIDKAILEAKSVVRRLERERAGISEEEMRRLAEQLREAEERTDSAGSQPATPLDLEAALAKALQGRP